MTHYETRGAALDRFLTGHNIDPDDVLSVSMSKHSPADEDIRVHIYTRVPGLEYVPDEETPSHTVARVEREDLSIDVVYVHSDSKETVA